MGEAVTSPLVAGIMRGFTGTTLHAWMLGERERCGKCMNCTWFRFDRERVCERSTEPTSVVQMCRSRNSETLAEFERDLADLGAYPWSAVTCMTCRKALAKLGLVQLVPDVAR